MSDLLDEIIADDSTPIAQAVALDIRHPQRHAHAREVDEP